MQEVWTPHCEAGHWGKWGSPAQQQVWPLLRPVQHGFAVGSIIPFIWRLVRMHCGAKQSTKTKTANGNYLCNWRTGNKEPCLTCPAL